MNWVCTYSPTKSNESEQPMPDGEQTAPEGTQPTPEELPSQTPSQGAGVPQISADPVYELVDGAWKQISYSTISAGDILLFAVDQNGEFVWLVRIKKADTGTTTTPGGTGGFPSGGTGSYPPAVWAAILPAA